MIRVGIVGVGATVAIAHNHIRAFQNVKGSRVSALYSRNINSVKSVAEKLCPDALAAESFGQLLDNCDAVVICTPNSWHFQYASEALKARKHVLLEKPMGVDIAQSEMLCNLVTSQTVAAVGYCNRFLPAVVQAKKLIESNFKRIYSVDVSHGGLRLANASVGFEWRMDKKLSGKGSVCDFGSHVIDLVGYLCNARFDRMACFSKMYITHRTDSDGRNRLVENDDCSVAVASGDTLLSLVTSRVGLDGLHVEISGDGGIIRFDDSLHCNFRYLFKQCGKGYTSTWQTFEVTQDRQQVFDRQASAFIDAVNGKPSECATFAEALYAEKLLSKCSQL